MEGLLEYLFILGVAVRDFVLSAAALLRLPQSPGLFSIALVALLAVLLLVLIVRTLILPLTIKSVKSSKAMQKIQPEMQKLREQFKDDPQRMQQEQMRLFQENRVNPAAGCLPLSQRGASVDLGIAAYPDGHVRYGRRRADRS